jgi:hypothetical protein
MTGIQVNDYVIKTNKSHTIVGKIIKLDLRNYINPIVVRWPERFAVEQCNSSQLTVVTREDNPEYFI